MKKNEIITKVTSAVNTATIKVKKHSPEILIVAGVEDTTGPIQYPRIVRVELRRSPMINISPRFHSSTTNFTKSTIYR